MPIIGLREHANLKLNNKLKVQAVCSGIAN